MSKEKLKSNGTTTVYGKDGKITTNLPIKGKTPPSSKSLSLAEIKRKEKRELALQRYLLKRKNIRQ